MNKLTFLCSPNWGIVDTWLPIIDKIKKNKGYQIELLILKTSMIRLLDINSFLIQNLNSQISGVVFVSFTDNLIKCNNLQTAMSINKKIVYWPFIKLLKRGRLKRLFKYPIFFYIKILQLWEQNYLKEGHVLGYKELIDNMSGLLFDIHESEKEYYTRFSKHIREIPKFSIFHGLEIGGQREKIKLNSNKSNLNSRVYIFSKNDRKYYKDKYGIDDSKIIFSGIPKYDSTWISYIKKSCTNSEIKWENYVTLISRPSIGPYLPIRRKHQALIAIKELIVNKMKKKLVIKIHPKQSDISIYFDVFGTETYDIEWRFTNEHAFVLSSRSDFGISLYSGVVVDFLFGNAVPSIEYSDMVGIPECDNDLALRDKKGYPVFGYRYNEVVLGANNYDELYNNVKLIMNEKEKVVNTLINNFNKVYQRVENPISTIVTDIINIVV